MPKMVDMGKKPEKGAEIPVPAGGEPKIYYPTLSLYDKVPDELMDKPLGSMCRIEIVGKIINKGIDENKRGRRESMSIDIHKMGYIGKAGRVSKEEYNKMSDSEKEDYDKESVGLK